MVKMQIFKPRMDEIQKKYANNKEKMNEEMMKLYQEENYNPMSGCLPMAIQMPILFGLYDVIQRPLTHLLRVAGPTIESATEIAAGLLNNANLAKDYSRQIRIIDAVNQNPDAFSGLGDFVQKVQSLDLSIGPIDLTQQPTFALNILLLIPILSFLTSVLVSWVSMRQSAAAAGDNAAAAGMSKGMMLMMPLMSAWISFVVPAGLGVYWVISNLLMALQTFLLNRYMNPAKLAAKAQAEYEAKKEADRQAKIEAKKRARERGEKDIDAALSQKEINRIKLAEARKRDAEKYGEVYKEVTDDDLKA
ncbi:membrane protein insertase YidC [uncultured Anaerotruncus sp.]|nr:membrane protein insertase YidC [uncultured Anaerotruncus sp.]